MNKLILIFILLISFTFNFAQDTPLFEVKDVDNATIFSVTPTGITILGMKFKTVVEENKLELYDADDNKLFYASPENARFIFHEPDELTDVDRGGFAISTVASGQATDEDGVNYFDITPDNTFIGKESGLLNTDGDKNIFIGYQSGSSNTEGEKNVFIGYQSGLENIGEGSFSGDFNVFIGNESGKNNNSTGESGISNVFIGNKSGMQNITGSQNVFIGKMTGLNNDDGGENTYLGFNAGKNNTEGNDNTYIGARSGADNLNGSSNVFIGYRAGISTTGSNQLYIENSDDSTPLIHGDFSADVVTINDVLKIAPRSSAPSPAEEGMMYYNSSAHKLYVYNGSSWQACW